MKFRVKFNESKVVHTVRADKKEDFVKYITENVSKISEIEKLDESVSDLPDGGDGDDRIFQEFCKTLNKLANYWEDLALEKRNKAFNECAESLRGVVALYKEKWDNR